MIGPRRGEGGSPQLRSHKEMLFKDVLKCHIWNQLPFTTNESVEQIARKRPKHPNSSLRYFFLNPFLISDAIGEWLTAIRFSSLFNLLSWYRLLTHESPIFEDKWCNFQLIALLAKLLTTNPYSSYWIFLCLPCGLLITRLVQTWPARTVSAHENWQTLLAIDFADKFTKKNWRW